MPAVPATPTRNTTVPAANRNPKNRTSKRIVSIRSNPAPPKAPSFVRSFRRYGSLALSHEQKNSIVCKDLATISYNALAVAELGLFVRAHHCLLISPEQ